MLFNQYCINTGNNEKYRSQQNMATLVSPGVSVSVIDESIGVASGQGTVPFVLIATEQDKTVPDGSETAVGTTAANAGKVYLMSSQRELLQTFGDPAFASIGGTQIHGDPANEFGLLAAHSYLGLANRAYVVRADIDTAALAPSVTPPTNPKPVGTVWLDTNDTLYGLNMYTDADMAFGAQTISATSDIAPPNTTEFDDLPVGAIVVSFENGIEYYVNLGESEGEGPQVLNSDNEWILTTGNYSAYSVSPTYPNDPIDGYYWVKSSIGTTQGVEGADFVIRVRDLSGSYVRRESPMLTDTDDLTADENATEYYDGEPATGDFYIYGKTFDDGGLTAQFELRVYDASSGTWARTDDYFPSDVEPTDPATDGDLWYNPDVGLDGDGYSTVDLLINSADSGSNQWENVALPGFGYDPADIIATPGNRPIGPLLYLLSSDPSPIYGTNVMTGDIWVDTDQLDAYPVMYRRNALNTAWDQIDNSDQTTPSGAVFTDARPDPMAAELDFDAPDPDAYPVGFLLWNTRFSTRNVKEWDSDYIYDADTGVYEGRWVTVSGNAQDGSPNMGNDARKALIVTALAEVLVGNEDIRSETIFFNLMATPGYPEVIDEMVALNIDRKETAFVIGDSPFDLNSSSTDLLAWASNQNNSPGNSSTGLVSADPNLGIYYPSGLGTNVDGSDVVVPSSHMMLRTIGFNDQVAYPWFAPAGLQRGRVSNASAVGYIDDEGEFVAVTLNQGQRDTLYTNNVNPIAFIPNQGLVVYGQKTRNPAASALDRVNVARLVEYIRYHSERMSQPFLFEPNDSQTRSNVKDAFDRFMAELVTLRGLYDFLVVCDTSNNTPARIDKNELWIDIAIQPVKAIEFIYIPIRIKATGSDLSL